VKTKINLLRPEDVWHPHVGGRPGNRNALKTGQYTAEKQAARRYISSFIARALAAARQVETEMDARERGEPPP
jgi:hypothetical protein